MRKIALFALLFLALTALIGPLLSPYDYSDIHLALKNSPPSTCFWFGTDELGRDLFTRVCWGTRISLFIGLTAAFIDMLLGVLWGGAAALLGGKTEEAMMRFCDILSSLPYLLVVILLTVIRGAGIVTILIAMTITGWISMARITRSQIAQLNTLDYVTAARVIGASKTRILFHHLIPNAMGPILATAMMTIPSAIFTEAFLSFLGLGIQAPKASLGVMLNEGLGALSYYPWRLFIPAFALTLIMLLFNGLKDARS